ncbi:MAG: GTP-binding protein [Steroidobacteraceae bacterium]|nr:GTP-binding protein [Steroidobacteraceae bacterium]
MSTSGHTHTPAVLGRIPILLITGFLGSGKTTLVNRLLADPAMSRTLVLVNEFGQVSIDTDLITRQGETMVELSNGCVCCTLIDDLGTTLQDFVDRRAKGQLPAFDRVLIETTGLANAGPIIRVLQEDERVRTNYAVDKVITTVDGLLGMKNLDLHAEAVEQVALADRLVLTKVDRISDRSALEPLRSRLCALNAGAELLEAEQGKVDVGGLLGGRPVSDVRVADAPANTKHACDDPHCEHTHDERGHHQAHESADRLEGPNATARHDAHIRSISLVSERALSLADLDRFWKRLQESSSPNLLRVKGLIQVAETPDNPVVVQGVQQLYDEPVTLPAWPSEDRRTRIVFIGWMLDRRQFESLLP